MKIVVSDADRFYKQTEMQEKYPIGSKFELTDGEHPETRTVLGYVIRKDKMYIDTELGYVNYENMGRLTR